MYDLIIWSDAFGSQLGYPNWKPQANFVSDRVIEIFDAVIIAANYGKTLLLHNNGNSQPTSTNIGKTN